MKALQGIDLEVTAGSIHALIGQQGAGKSTLVNVLSGVYRPDAGQILLYGKAVDFSSPDDALKQGISLLHQERAVVPDLDVTEEIFHGQKASAKFAPEAGVQLYDRSERLLAELKLSLSPRTRSSTLSGGAWQMIQIAKAVSRASKLLILDEPTSALTAREQRRLSNCSNTSKGAASPFCIPRIEQAR